MSCKMTIFNLNTNMCYLCCLNIFFFFHELSYSPIFSCSLWPLQKCQVGNNCCFSSVTLQMNGTLILSRRSSPSSSFLQSAGRPFPTHGKRCCLYISHLFKRNNSTVCKINRIHLVLIEIRQP